MASNINGSPSHQQHARKRRLDKGRVRIGGGSKTRKQEGLKSKGPPIPPQNMRKKNEKKKKEWVDSLREKRGQRV